MIAVYFLVLGMTMVFEMNRNSKSRISEHLEKKLLKMNKNLQRLVEERTQRVVKLQKSILKTMSNLVESRDSVTGGHVERTQYGVYLILDEIKKQKLFEEIINDWDIGLILQSVQLHDIGKIAISD